MPAKIQEIRPDGSVFTVLLHWDKISEKLHPDEVKLSIDGIFAHHPEKFIAEIQIVRTMFAADLNRYHYCAIIKVELAGIAIMGTLQHEDLHALFIQAMGTVSNILNSGISENSINDFINRNLELAEQDPGDGYAEDYLPSNLPNTSEKNESPIKGEIDWTAFNEGLRAYKPKPEQ